MTEVASTLVVLDVFTSFAFPGGQALFDQAKPAVEQIRQLRNRFHQARRPVIFINDHFGRWQDGFDQLLAHVEHSGDQGRHMVSALRPVGGDFTLLKPRHSAFFETALPSLLAYLDSRRIVVTGLATDSCVLCTALDAHVRGIESIVPVDTTAAQTKERTDRTLLHLRQTCGLATPWVRDIWPGGGPS